jgi:hypothetical protein
MLSMVPSFTRYARLTIALCAACLGAVLPAEAADKPTRGITIESSAQESIARPGSWVTVKVGIDDSLKASRVSLLIGTWDELISFVDEAPPFEFVLPIDRKWSGPIKVMYSVLSSRDKLIGSGKLVINVVPSDLPASIAVTDPVKMVANSGANRLQEHINVRGTYADGIVRNVGRLDLGTSFHSSDPRVVKVDGEGFLTAGVPGRAVVTVKNGLLSKVVPVDVRPNSSRRSSATAVSSEVASSLASGRAAR